MKSVFCESWLSSSAETILAAILEQDFQLSDAKVKGTWSVLCSDLVIAGNPAFVGSISMQNERRAETEVRRQLWTVVARVWQSFEERFTWQDVVSFLLIPLE